MAKAKLIERVSRQGDYGVWCESLIIDHANHGRLLLLQGWGGNKIEGECYRYKYGICVKLKESDTFARIADYAWCITHGCDSTRPILNWNGYAIEKLASSFD